MEEGYIPVLSQGLGYKDNSKPIAADFLTAIINGLFLSAKDMLVQNLNLIKTTDPQTGYTALHYLVYYSNSLQQQYPKLDLSEMMLTLLEYDADPNLPGINCETPWHLAAALNQQLFIDMAQPQVLYNQYPKRSQVRHFTPTYLLDDKQGFNVFHIAAMFGHWESVISALKYFGAKPQQKNNINYQDHLGWTPLDYAVRAGDYTSASTLITYGADPIYPGSPNILQQVASKPFSGAVYGIQLPINNATDANKKAITEMLRQRLNEKAHQNNQPKDHEFLQLLLEAPNNDLKQTAMSVAYQNQQLFPGTTKYLEKVAKDCINQLVQSAPANSNMQKEALALQRGFNGNAACDYQQRQNVQNASFAFQATQLQQHVGNAVQHNQPGKVAKAIESFSKNTSGQLGSKPLRALYVILITAALFALFFVGGFFAYVGPSVGWGMVTEAVRAVSIAPIMKASGAAFGVAAAVGGVAGAIGLGVSFNKFFKPDRDIKAVSDEQVERYVPVGRTN